MIAQTAWMERTFNFSYPAGVFPCILERLRGTPARAREMLSGIPAQLLAGRPAAEGAGGWSALEHLGHLWDLDELHEGRVDDYLAGLRVLRPADVTNARTWQGNYNSRSAEEILRGFRTARENFVRRAEGLGEAQILTVALHPRLKQPMRLMDMLLFVAEHDDHHLARMRALVAAGAPRG